MSTDQLQPLSPASAQSFLESLQASFTPTYTDLVNIDQRPMASSGRRPGPGQGQGMDPLMTVGKDDHKRKNDFRERDLDEDVSSDEDEHDEKKKAGRGGARRKSGGNAAAGTGEGKDPVKLNKRKEQNRAAQKAFRERREARVKDLEAKVAELENKQFGVTIENENLRELLTRLQQENVALKQSAFTFSVPVPSHGQKPISPPTTEGSLASVQDSPASVDSTPSQTFHADPYNAFIAGSKPQPPTFTHRQSSESSLGWSPLNAQTQAQTDADVQALFESFYPANNNSQMFPQPEALASGINPTPFTLLNTAPAAMSYREEAPSAPAAPPAFSAYREPVFPDAKDEALMDDFLASLITPADQDPFNAIPDIEPGAADLYNQIFNQPQSYTPASSVPSSQSAFSPSQFLNASPSSSAQTAPSPATSGTGSERQGSVLSVTKAQLEAPLQTFGAVPADAQTFGRQNSEEIHVISKDGRLWKPLELWESVRNEFTTSDDLVIDDLCDQMKSKAKCSGGKAVIDEECVRDYFKHAADRHNAGLPQR